MLLHKNDDDKNNKIKRTKSRKIIWVIILLAGLVLLLLLLILMQVKLIQPFNYNDIKSITSQPGLNNNNNQLLETIIDPTKFTSSVQTTYQTISFVDKLLTQDDFKNQIAQDCLDFLPNQEDKPSSYIVVRPENPPDWLRTFKRNDNNNNPVRETDQQRARSFDFIYHTKTWSLDNPSGAGSTRKATEQTMKILSAVVEYIKKSFEKEFFDSVLERKNIDQQLVRELKRKSNTPFNILDLACGDLTWIPHWLSNYTQEAGNDIHYTGVDIVPEAIKNARNRFPPEKYPTRHFYEHDMVQSPISTIPNHHGRFHLIFLRHVLQHLPTDGVRKALHHIQTYAQQHATDTNARPIFVLTTTYPDWPVPDIDLHETFFHRMRKLNLQQEPFLLPTPICWSHDYSASFLALWRFPTISV
jgi:hypothetical protein